MHEHEPSVPRTPGRDFVDRGKNGLECICLLLAYKIKYPENFFLLRGNHECASINRIYGFYDECKRRYNIKLWKKFQEVFNVLPIAAVVDEKIFCVHAGISPELNTPQQINNVMRPTDVPDSGARLPAPPAAAPATATATATAATAATTATTATTATATARRTSTSTSALTKAVPARRNARARRKRSARRPIRTGGDPEMARTRRRETRTRSGSSVNGTV